MTIRSLGENFSGTPAWATGLVDSYEMGHSWRTTAPSPITHLGWYRGATGSAGRPTHLRLWDAVSLQQVCYVNVPEDLGTVAWQWSLLDTPFLPIANRTYIVAYTIPAGGGWATFTDGSYPAPSTGLERVSPRRRFNTNGPNLFPQTADSAVIHLVDFKMDTGATTPAPPLDTSNIGNSLAHWLSSTDAVGTTDSLPLQTQALLTGSNGVAAIKAEVVDNGNDLGTLLGRTASLVGGSIQSALTAMKNELLLAVGEEADTWITLGNDMNRLLGIGAASPAASAGGPQNMAQWTADGWTEVDSGAFSGPFRVSTRCDRVYVHITTVGGANASVVIETLEFGSFAWWWCPTFANMAGRYHTSRAREAVLYEPGMRMDGAVVVLPADFEGTYVASRFDG